MPAHNHLTCEAPICLGDPTPGWEHGVIWYPGEAVCTRRPMAHGQKVQNRINKLLAAGKFKYPDRYYTFEVLDSVTRVTGSTSGLKRLFNKGNRDLQPHV